MFKRYLKNYLPLVVLFSLPFIFSFKLPFLAPTLAPVVASNPVAVFVSFLTKMRLFAQNDVVSFIPYLLFAAIAFFSYQMNLRKILFACGFLTFGLWATTRGFPESSVQTFLFAAPLSLALMMFLKESKIFGRNGVWLLGATVVPWLCFSAIQKFAPTTWNTLVSFHFMKFWATSYVPQLSFALWAVALVTPLIHHDRYLRRLHWAFAIGFAPCFYVFENRYLSKVDASVFFACYGLYIFAATLSVYLQKIYMDELTGIPNRRALNEALSRLSGNYTIAMIDIDHFKKFNDTHGHDHGDNVLTMVGQHVFQKSGGIAYRFGGEEFTLLFPGKLADEVFAEADALRQSLADRNFYLREKTKRGPINFIKKFFAGKPTAKKAFKITISIGIAGNPGAKKTVDEVFKTADECLYKAKESGRNCVIADNKLTRKAS